MPTSVFLDLNNGQQFAGQMVGPAADNSAAPPFTFVGDLDTGYASSAANTLALVTGGSKALTLTSTAATFLSGLIGTFSQDGIAATSTDALILSNATASTALVTAQRSPRQKWVGTAWNSSGGGTSETGIFAVENLPVTQAGTIIATMRWKYANSAVSAGAFTDIMTLNQLGNLVLPVAATGISVTSSGNFGVTSVGFLRGTGTTGQWKLENANVSAGVGLDVATDAILRIRNTAYNADATITALTFQNANQTNGQKISDLQTLTELTTIAVAASTDTTIQMPANSVVLAVTVRTTVTITTAVTYTVGDSGSAARFSTAAVSTTAGGTDPGTKAGAYYNATALSVRITPNTTPGDANGRVRVVIYYYSVTPPTS